MIRLLFCAVALLLMPVLAHAQQRTFIDRNNPEIRAVLDTTRAGIDSARRTLKIPGVSVAIVYDQNLLFGEGFGLADIRNGIAPGIETVYRVGSVTKVLTALALMQLQDAGKLATDDPIEKYLPEFRIRSRFLDARPTNHLADHGV